VLKDALAIGAPETVAITGGKIPVTLEARTAAIYRAL
jgi:hypothetical protein